MEPQPVWLTVKQAAARAQVAPWTIYHEVRAGRLRAARIGGVASYVSESLYRRLA